ncbi:unnamed protein product (macronuclear) [Paramecium tetraurelia]|uniref:Uncharacterized protein n=1 Tax=Paramecium tetraurelia TaxID=5888 RepID=A0DYT6_PARTE|nr:uncharacterized protein GSPATT00003171001 [Paramecium tetraurelia]CAK88203.1 unnamed protein product [Paramecium tetraurelia]|eukprot:XP_001455600.1 hypothetical protein (macronuclear) [Paramecium tetraurelia strain d4-2]
MLDQTIEVPISKIMTQVSKVYVPINQNPNEKIAILYENIGRQNLKEVWRLQFLNQNVDLLMRQTYDELFYLNQNRILILKGPNIITYNLHEKIEVDSTIQIEKGEYNHFSVYNNGKEQFLFFLTKQNVTTEQQQSVSQYTLRIYDTQKLEVLQEVKFSASVRALVVSPISRTKCFMMNPNSPTNRTLQFIIYDENQVQSKIINVKETKNELRGTVVKVLNYQDELIFVYNSNGVSKQFLLFYCIENGNENIHEIDIQYPFQIRDATIKENIILISCFNSQLNSENAFFYEILEKKVKMISSGETNHFYSKYIIVQHNRESIHLQLMATPSMMMTHYMDKIDYDQYIKEEISQF